MSDETQKPKGVYTLENGKWALNDREMTSAELKSHLGGQLEKIDIYGSDVLFAITDSALEAWDSGQLSTADYSKLCTRLASRSDLMAMTFSNRSQANGGPDTVKAGFLRELAKQNRDFAFQINLADKSNSGGVSP